MAGTFAGSEFQVEAHRFQDREQIGKDNGGIDAQPPHGGDHHFCAERRILAQF